MDNFIIFILLASLALAGVTFWLGWLAPEHQVLGRHRVRGSFLFIVAIMIPFLIWVLWAQYTDTRRLAELGIVPYPGIQSSIGAPSVVSQQLLEAQGKGETIADHWLFKAEGDPQDIFAFYQKEPNRPGWKIQKTNKMGLTLERDDGTRLNISFYERYGELTLLYMLTPS